MTQFRRESCCEPGASLEKRVGVDSGIGEVAGHRAGRPGAALTDLAAGLAG